MADSDAVFRALADPTRRALLDRLRETLDEKLTLLEGAQEAASTNQYEAGYLPGIPRLGIPSLRLSDGPPGVATRQPSVGMTGTMGVAATFSQRDAYLNGVVIGRDARALGVDVVLEPFVNIDRDPTWSRAFNTFGEDPLLTGQTGAGEISGIQSQGTMAMVKHFIAYDGGNNVVVDSQTLHEIYLEPFADAINAGVASIMCSYNTVSVVAATPVSGGTPGPYSCGNARPYGDPARRTGLPGVRHVRLGRQPRHQLHQRRPGHGDARHRFSDILPTYFSAADLKAAIAAGTVSISTIDAAVGHILYEMDRFGLLSGHSKHNVTPEPVNADEQVVQQTGQDAATLLKNDAGALPLSHADLSHLALIGPGAGQTIAVRQAGENAAGIVSRQTGTYQVLQQALRHDPAAHLTYAVGDDMTGTPVPAPRCRTTASQACCAPTTATAQRPWPPSLTTPALTARRWPPAVVHVDRRPERPGRGQLLDQPGLLGAGGSISLDGTGRSPPPGSCNGTAPRYGVLRPGDINVLPTTDGLDNLRTQLNLSAGQHTLTVAVTADVSGDPVQARLNWVTPAQQQAGTDAAVAAAKQAKTAVVFAWSYRRPGHPATRRPGPAHRGCRGGQPGHDRGAEHLRPDRDALAGPGQGACWKCGTRATPAATPPPTSAGDTDPAGRLPFTWPAALDQGVANQPATHPERTSNGVDANGKFCTTPGSPFGGQRAPPPTPRASSRATAGMTSSTRPPLPVRVRPVLHPLRLFRPALGTRPRRRRRRLLPGGQHRVRHRRRSRSLPGTPASPPAGVPFADRALGAMHAAPCARPVPARPAARATRQLQYWDTQSGTLGNRSRAAAALRGQRRRSADLTTTITIPGGGH